MKQRILFALFAFLAATTAPLLSNDSQPPAGLSPAERGYFFLTQKAYLPPDFSQEVFDSVWKKWPEPLRSEAEKASPEKRRELSFSRYGLTPRPDDPSRHHRDRLVGSRH